MNLPRPIVAPVLLALALALPSCVLSIGGGSRSTRPSTTASPSTSAAELRRQNGERLARLVLGMDRAQVDAVMGTESVWLEDLGWVGAPHRTSSYRDAQGREITVLSYYTDLVKRDDLIQDEELTPVVLRDGELIGWGRDFPVPEAGS
jgi:hypothetical protein